MKPTPPFAAEETSMDQERYVRSKPLETHTRVARLATESRAEVVRTINAIQTEHPHQCRCSR